MVFTFSLVHRLRSKLSLLVLQFTLMTVCCFRVGCVEATTLEATTTRHILRLSLAWMDTGRQIGFGYRPVVGKTNQYDRTAVIWRTDRRLDSEAVEMLREDLQASAGRWTGKEGAPQWTASPGGRLTSSHCLDVHLKLGVVDCNSNTEAKSWKPILATYNFFFKSDNTYFTLK